MDAPGFDFTACIRPVIADMIRRLPPLQHIDLNRVALSFAQARNHSSYGVYASLTPMRFERGERTTQRRGREFTVQRLFGDDGTEMLYILTFYLPRFMNLDFDEKLITILHELWHISPHFDGDIRRHPGRCYAHTHSQEDYDARMKILAGRWLATYPPTSVFEFLQLDFASLRDRFGAVYGLRIPHPKLIACAL